jgi:hypothetical protein
MHCASTMIKFVSNVYSTEHNTVLCIARGDPLVYFCYKPLSDAGSQNNVTQRKKSTSPEGTGQKSPID